ncbi:AzlC family ABC transporter permease [Siminovitchia sediminis]|uniref:AzlC family ABC transporter permease n=1 Tax=Siminovitchia sediminis TaxID=1274353 RepID=A0ABW4KG59_9BACI
MKTYMGEWKSGLKNGIPIGMGYFAVSFTFGILAKQAGLNPFESVFMSVTNLTSAGQFAGLTLIASAAAILEIAITQLIINSRYFLMSFALSQKIDPNTSVFHRLIMAHGITDEVFGVSVAVPGKLSPYYVYGVMSAAIPGWALGTLFGVISGNVLPPRLMSALSIALFGMLLAVIIPPAKGNKVIAGLIFVSMVLSLVFTRVQIFASLSSGVKIIIITLFIAGIAAFVFPVKEDTYE